MKNELTKEKNKTIYINLYKIEIEKLKKEVKEVTEKSLEKDTEHKNEIEKLRNKITKIYLKEAYEKTRSDKRTN